MIESTHDPQSWCLLYVFGNHLINNDCIEIYQNEPVLYIRPVLTRAYKVSLMAPKSSLTATKLHEKALLVFINPAKRYEITESMIMGRHFKPIPTII